MCYCLICFSDLISEAVSDSRWQADSSHSCQRQAPDNSRKSSYQLLENTLGREDIQYLLHNFKYWSGLLSTVRCYRMSCDSEETVGHPMYNLCGQVQGSTSQLSSLSGNRKSAALLEVRGNISKMQYSSVPLDPETPMDNGSGIPHSTAEGRKAAASTESEVHRACTTKCFHSRYLTKTSTQGDVYNFLERPSGWKCFIYHFTV